MFFLRWSANEIPDLFCSCHFSPQSFWSVFCLIPTTTSSIKFRNNRFFILLLFIIASIRYERIRAIHSKIKPRGMCFTSFTYLQIFLQTTFRSIILSSTWCALHSRSKPRYSSNFGIESYSTLNTLFTTASIVVLISLSLIPSSRRC